ncbi:metallophosphoesterase [Streptomyces sp. NBC_00391]|uniref:metallophosphoesterase n=1 Tax=Streptomyces sp. NBC_00391 TaxID=2903647 RepID=UPI002E249A46
MSALFVALMLPLLAAVHYYVWRRTVRDTTVRGSRPRRIGTAVIMLLGLCLVLAPPGEWTLPRPLAVAVVWAGFLWAAVLLYLTLALLVGEAVRPLLLRAARHRPAAAAPPAAEPAQVPAPVPAPAAVPGTGTGTGTAAEEGTAAAGTAHTAQAAVPDPSRRLFVARGIALAAGAAAAATVGHGARTALGPPRLKHLTVPLTRLHPRAHGFRIALVSDIHLNTIAGRARTEQIVDLINGTEPDLVAVVGDLVEDGSVRDMGRAAEPLARLRAAHGSFFVTGNHEYHAGAEQWLDLVRDLGLRPLENEHVALEGFDLAGVNDVTGEEHGQGPDYDAALAGRDPDRAVVLLAHQPVQVHEAAARDVDLQLSGHTHGGQFWPFTYLPALSQPTVAGLDRYGDTQLYVTRGTGFWGPPVRVGADPDITVVELASPRA